MATARKLNSWELKDNPTPRRIRKMFHDDEEADKAMVVTTSMVEDIRKKALKIESRLQAKIDSRVKFIPAKKKAKPVKRKKKA